MAVKFFGQYLVERGLVSREILLKALELQESVNLRFGEMALTMGFIGQNDVEAIHRAQWKDDLPFGEMAVKLGILTQDQKEQVLIKQRNNHLYIGEAIFKIGGLDQEEIKRYLEDFKADQAGYQMEGVIIPPEVPIPLIWEIAADLTFKMLSRIANLSFNRGNCSIVQKLSNNEIVAMIQLKGHVQGQYILSVGGVSKDKIAAGILGQENVEGESAEVINDAVMEFINVVCGNIAAKAAQLGKTVEISPPVLLSVTEKEITVPVGHIGMLFPIHVPTGERVELAGFVIK
jgi:CheY-specific phosphatase CheX